MWPFNLFGKQPKLRITRIDGRFSTSAQIKPDQIETLAQAGYTAILCARPDKEQQGQPPFADIAREAKKHGIKAIHIPISGMPNANQAAICRKALAEVDGPVIGYCRSGARATSLYRAATR
ncbi:MAG: sulfur transferase domain-containing protein [Paracoccaceae bacterium]